MMCLRRLWETRTVAEQASSLGAEGQGLEGHGDRVTSAALSPCGRLLASASWDGTLSWGLWEGVVCYGA